MMVPPNPAQVSLSPNFKGSDRSIVVVRLTTISWLRATKHAKLKTLRLPDGLYLSPGKIDNLLYLTQYADLYAHTQSDKTTKTMWFEMKMEHYELF